MPDMVHEVKRVGLGVAILRGTLALALLLPTAAWAGGHTIRVQPPNGVDDTANVQSALDMAAASGRGVTVQLAPGKYRTKQLLTFNFHGTFKGAGKHQTTIEALPNLVVDCPDICAGYQLLDPNAKNYHWSSYIMFVEGDIDLADLTIRTPWTGEANLKPYLMCGDFVTAWLDVVKFTGQYPMNVNVDRIVLEGTPDDFASTGFGYNAFNGLTLGGDFLKDTPDVQYWPLGGKFTIRNSEFRGTAAGFCNYFAVKDARVLIGGSPSTGNLFEQVGGGIDLETAESSRFEVSYNRSSGRDEGMNIAQYYGDAFIPAKPSQFLIHDNQFSVAGTNPDFVRGGVYLMNDPGYYWLQATVYNNTIETHGMTPEGIGVYNTRGTILLNNTITGSGNDAIGLWNTSFCTVLGNHLGGFLADPSAGLAQVYLDPATSHNLIFCANPLDTVLDQGADNKIFGGWPMATASAEAFSLKAAPSTSLSRSDPLRRKPLRR